MAEHERAAGAGAAAVVGAVASLAGVGRAAGDEHRQHEQGSDGGQPSRERGVHREFLSPGVVW